MKLKNSLSIDLLKTIVTDAATNHEGRAANYIPELANANTDLTAISVQQLGKETLTYSNAPIEPITLQSTAKLIPLIGLLEEFGVDQLLTWVNVEPSGDEFSSITRLEQLPYARIFQALENNNLPGWSHGSKKYLIND